MAMLSKKSKPFAGLLALALLAAASPAKSDTTHNQSAVDVNAFGWDSVSGNKNVQQIADDFRPPVDGIITVLRWTGKYHKPTELSAKRFEVRVFADDAGIPGPVVFAQTLMVRGIVTGSKDSGGHALLSYTAPLENSPVLSSDRIYWLSIREDDPSTSATWSWSFHNADIPGGYSYRRGEKASWAIGATDMAYSLSVDPKK